MTDISTDTAAISGKLLLSFLPGVSRETLAVVIVGNLIRTVPSPDSYKRVLLALILHGGWHSNRVWASYTRLAELAECSVKTAARGMRFWCERGTVRLIPWDELEAGPGEHTYRDRGGEKEGDGPVNHYDIGGLSEHIPAEIIAAFNALVSGRQMPFTPAGMLRQGRTSGSDQIPRDFPDPWEDSTPPSPEVRLLSSDIYQTSHEPNSPCNVKNIDESKRTGTEKTPLTPGSGKPFEGTKMAGRISDSGGDAEARLLPAKTQGKGLYQVLVTSRGKGGRGFDIQGAHALIQEIGERYPDNQEQVLRELVTYARWRERKDGALRGPGWIIETFRAWPGHWPTPFENYLDRMEANRQRTVKAPTNPSQPTDKKETSPTETSFQRDTPTAGDLAARQIRSAPSREGDPSPADIPTTVSLWTAPEWWTATVKALAAMSLPARMKIMTPVSLEAEEGIGLIATVAVPASHMEMIRKKYLGALEEALATAAGQVVSVRLVRRPAGGTT